MESEPGWRRYRRVIDAIRGHTFIAMHDIDEGRFSCGSALVSARLAMS